MIIKTIKILALLFFYSTYACGGGLLTVTEFETLDQGGSSKYSKRLTSPIIEIYDNDSWQEFWAQHTFSGIEKYPSKQRPSVDFTKHFVVVVIAETPNSNSSSIEAKSVQVSSTGKLSGATIESSVVAPGAFRLAIEMRPYHIILVKYQNR